MRRMISGLVAAVAVMATAPAMACGYSSPCAQPPVYVAPVATGGYSSCYTGCGWAHDRLADPARQYHRAEPLHQYYYVNQGPTLTGPGAFAPLPTYEGRPVYGYTDGPYVLGAGHYYDGASLEGPQVYTYRPDRHYAPVRYYHGRRVLRRSY